MVKGTWQIIQWCPDLVAREWLNIGVGFKDKKCQHFKYLDDFKKIESFYDQDTKIHLIAVLKLVKEFFDNGNYDFSPQIKLIEVGFQQGESIEINLNNSYEAVVTLRECEESSYLKHRKMAEKKINNGASLTKHKIDL
ncbi:hypothetical protein KTH44_16120 [Acinetobacter bereziniae]|uniref:hypothetical protein n=1 Tax=Acinetobacter bereziniae TaxID=106648 RepID=UPI0021CDBC69|nr:hypothetical protein [Acinetobacter bereziniae]MCU4320644.1 hypothetical protein [Acinetobacter bereziniae]